MIKIFDSDETHDLLWADRISPAIASLVASGLGDHCPPLGIIWLIDRIVPNDLPWAEDWTTKTYEFLKKLSLTHLLTDSVNNGAAYQFTPVYKATLPPNLGLATIPDQITLKIPKGKSCKISWLERSHEEQASGYLCNAVSNKISIWSRRGQEFNALDGELTVKFNSKQWLFNSVVITGLGTFTGLSQAQKDLILYSNLQSTLDSIYSKFNLTQCQVLRGCTANLITTFKTWKWTRDTGIGEYSPDFSPISEEVVTYTNPLFANVPNNYSFACLQIAKGNFLGKSPVIVIDNLTLSIYFDDLYLEIPEIPFPKLEFSLFIGFGETLTLEKEVSTAILNISGSINFEDKVTSNLYLNDGVTDVGVDKYFYYSYNNANIYYTWGVGRLQITADVNNPSFPPYGKYREIETYNNVLMRRFKIINFFLDKELFINSNTVLIQNSFYNLVYVFNEFSWFGGDYYLSHTSNYKEFRNKTAFSLNQSLSDGKTLTVSSSLIGISSDLINEKNESYGEVAYYLGPEYEAAYQNSQNYNTSTNKDSFFYFDIITQSASLNRDLRLTPINYAKLIIVTGNQITRFPNGNDAILDAFLLTLDPDTDNGNIMPDSKLVKENHFRLEKIAYFLGLSDQPDPKKPPVKYPDPYHVDSLSNKVLQGLDLSTFGKGKPSDPHPAGIYEVQTNRIEKDSLGNEKIKQGGYVKYFNLQQLLEQYGWDFGKGLNLQECGGIQIPKGDGSGFSTFGSSLEINLETLFLLSKLSKTINGLAVSASQNTLMTQSILSAIGVPLTLQMVPWQVGDRTCYITAPVVHPSAPSMMDTMYDIKLNLGFLVGSNFTLREIN